MFEGTLEAGKVETVTGAVDTDMFSPDPTARASRLGEALFAGFAGDRLRGDVYPGVARHRRA